MSGYWCKCLRKYSIVRLTQIAKAKYIQMSLIGFNQHEHMNMYNDNLSEETVMFLAQCAWPSPLKVMFLSYITSNF